MNAIGGIALVQSSVVVVVELIYVDIEYAFIVRKSCYRIIERVYPAVIDDLVLGRSRNVEVRLKENKSFRLLLHDLFNKRTIGSERVLEIVWAVADDFNYRNENGDTSFNDLDFLSNTVARRNLENNLVNACVALGVDGLNIDFEKLYSECGEHYAQFIKELSVLTHKNGLVLSTDNYVPFSYNEYNRLDVQGGFVDYVLIMGYDEHYHGSGNIGSVASFDYVCGGMDKTMQYVASERIINAVPFYTIVWKDEGSAVTDSYLTLVNQAEYISKYNISYEWDETTCQNYAEWKSGTTTYHVWFEDSKSLTSKLNAMNTRNIGGVGVWRIGYGTPEVWNLIGMYKNMKTESTN